MARIVDQEGSGVCGTLAHDVVFVPLGVIKCPGSPTVGGGVRWMGVCMRETDKSYLRGASLVEEAIDCL